MLAEYLGKEAKHRSDLGDQILRSLSAPMHAQRMAEIAAEMDARGRKKPYSVVNPTLASTLPGLAGKAGGFGLGWYLSKNLVPADKGAMHYITPSLIAGASGVAGYYAVSRLAKFIARNRAEQMLRKDRDTPVSGKRIDRKLLDTAREDPGLHIATSLLWPEKGVYTQSYIKALKRLKEEGSSHTETTPGTMVQEIASGIPGGQIVQGAVGAGQEHGARQELRKEYAPEELEKAAQQAAGSAVSAGARFLEMLRAPGRAMSPYTEKPLTELAQKMPVFSPSGWLGHSTGLVSPESDITQIRIKPVETGGGTAVERADTYVNPPVLESLAAIALLVLSKGKINRLAGSRKSLEWLARPRELTWGLPGMRSISRVTGNPELTVPGKIVHGATAGAIKYGAPSAVAITGYGAMGLDKPEGKGANIGRVLEKDREEQGIAEESIRSKNRLLADELKTSLGLRMAVGGVTGSALAGLLARKNKVLWGIAGGAAGTAAPYVVDRLKGLLDKKAGVADFISRKSDILRNAGLYEWMGDNTYNIGAGMSAGAAAAMALKGMQKGPNRKKWLAGAGGAAVLSALLAHMQGRQPDNTPSVADINKAGGRFVDYARMARNINAVAGLSGIEMKPVKENEIRSLYDTMKSEGPKSEKMKQSLAELLMTHKTPGSTFMAEDMKGLIDQAMGVEDPSIEQLPKILSDITSRSIKDTGDQLAAAGARSRQLKTSEPIDSQQLEDYRKSIQPLKPVRIQGKVNQKHF